MGRPTNFQVMEAQAQNSFLAYSILVHNAGKTDTWLPTKFHTYLTKTVQDFVENRTEKPYDILIINTPPQHGKLIGDEIPVLTTEGWKRHGELRVGDYVFNHKGESVKVTHVHPKGIADKEVTISTGEKILCHGRHEWLVYDRINKRNRVVETSHIQNSKIGYGEQGKRGYHYNFMLPERNIINGVKTNLEVEPYVLGAWLGDGTNTKPCVCSCVKDIVVLDEIQKHYEVSSENTHKDTGVITRYYKNLKSDLRKYGMCDTKRTEKHIPDDYIKSDVSDRLELLAGLIDTDGYVDHKHNRIVFCTSDEALKDSFINLIYTFGWHVSIYEAQPVLSTSGIQGKKVHWQLGFNPTIEIPCRIERKQLKSFSKQRRESITNVSDCAPVSGNCITVDGGIYLVGKTMVPTHNSVTVTETLPSWYLGKHPEHRVITVCYNEDFAQKFGRRNKEKVRDFGYLFNVGISNSTKSNTEWELDNEVGGMICRGVMSGLAGQKGNLIIIDDPVKNKEDAYSESYRQKVYDEWAHSIKTRTHPGTKVILIMTRWHDDDLAGRMMKEEDCQVINLPCECETDGDVLGRHVGDALCPEIGKDNKWLSKFKSSYIKGEGSSAWYALFQGNPQIEGGNLIKREWWKTYDLTPDFHKDCDELLMSVDASFKDTNDPVAITVWGRKKEFYYLIDLVNDHLNFLATIDTIKGLKKSYPAIRHILVEDRANGSAIIAQLRNQIPGIIPIEPFGGKIARVQQVSFAIESGNVFLPNRPWVKEFIAQCSAFPNSRHDDMVDSMSQALSRLVFRHTRDKKERKPYDYFRMMKKKENPKGETVNVV